MTSLKKAKGKFFQLAPLEVFRGRRNIQAFSLLNEHDVLTRKWVLCDCQTQSRLLRAKNNGWRDKKTAISALDGFAKESAQTVSTYAFWLGSRQRCVCLY